MTRNYPRPDTTAARDFAESRETHPAVAAAIIALSSTLSSRSADDVWAAPTQAEWDHVTMAVAKYVREGDYDPEPDGVYPWGNEMLSVA